MDLCFQNGLGCFCGPKREECFLFKPQIPSCWWRKLMNNHILSNLLLSSKRNIFPQPIPELVIDVILYQLVLIHFLKGKGKPTSWWSRREGHVLPWPRHLSWMLLLLVEGALRRCPFLFPEVLCGWLSSSSSLEPGFPGFGLGAWWWVLTSIASYVRWGLLSHLHLTI